MLKSMVLAVLILTLAATSCGGGGSNDNALDTVPALAGDTTTPTTDAVGTTAPIEDVGDSEATPVEGEASSPTTEPQPVPDTVGEDAIEPTPTTPHPDPKVDAAIADLAALVDVDAAEIGVITVEAVTWRDGSIGCPQPGMSYTQALVPGTRIVLQVGGIEYNYHAGRNGDPFYCAIPSEPLNSEAPPAIDQ